MPLRSVGLAHCTLKRLMRLQPSGLVWMAVAAPGAAVSSLTWTGKPVSRLPATSTE